MPLNMKKKKKYETCGLTQMKKKKKKYFLSPNEIISNQNICY